MRELIHSTLNVTGMVLDCEDRLHRLLLFGETRRDRQSHPTGRCHAATSPREARRVSTTLGKDGILDLIGTDKIHGNVQRAVSAQLDAQPPPTESTSRE